MKLHLPLGLLSSLIACMAAVSSPHALAETYTWLGGTDGWIHTNANWNPAPTNYANVVGRNQCQYYAIQRTIWR